MFRGATLATCNEYHIRALTTQGPFLENPDNLSGPISIFVRYVSSIFNRLLLIKLLVQTRQCAWQWEAYNLLLKQKFLQQIAEVLKSEDRLNESPDQVIYPEMTNCRNRNDVMLTIDPSHHSLSLDQQSQQGNTLKVPPEHQGIFSRESHGNICCIFIVAMAILLVSWIWGHRKLMC